MFEHLGFANHAIYFSTIHRLLKPGGIYLHHAITRRSKGDMKKTLRKGPEFKALIKYIFPGGELDTIGMTLGNLEAHGFLVYDAENLREHYAALVACGPSASMHASTRRSPKSVKPRRASGCSI